MKPFSDWFNICMDVIWNFDFYTQIFNDRLKTKLRIKDLQENDIIHQLIYTNAQIDY